MARAHVILVVTAALGVAGCSSTSETSAGPLATAPRAAPATSEPSGSSGSAAAVVPSSPSPSATPSASASSPVDPAAPPAPLEVFSAKISLLDRIDDAVMRGKPDDLAALATPGAALERCAPTSRDRVPAKIEIPEDCRVSGATLKRVAINVGSRLELFDATCELATLEKSELIYRIADHSFQITVQTVSVGKDVYLRKVHCHRSSRPTKETKVANCTGKWPLVTQTREFPECPWSPR